MWPIGGVFVKNSGSASQMIQMGMPLTADGKVEVSGALNWIETHIDLGHKDAVARRQFAPAQPSAPLPASTWAGRTYRTGPPRDRLLRW